MLVVFQCFNFDRDGFRYSFIYEAAGVPIPPDRRRGR